MKIWRHIARFFWAIGDAFIRLGDRAYDRVRPQTSLDYDQMVDATLRAKAEHFAANAARQNAVFDDLQKGKRPDAR